MNLKPIKQHIIFEFLDKVNNKGQFLPERTPSGIFLAPSVDDSAKNPRWGRVLAVGPQAGEEIQVGAEILIENLMWTQHVVLDGQKIWRTDESKVIAVRVK